MMRTLPILLFAASAQAGKSVPMELGDLSSGEALIKANCGRCDASKLHDPMLLAETGEAAIRKALQQGKGVGPLIGWSGKRLHELQAWDVVRYLRNYSISVADLIPTATHYAIEEGTPNEWGRERLVKQAKLFKVEPKEEQVQGRVLVVWEVPGTKGLTNVTGNTAVIGGFKKDQKKAYVLLRPITAGKTKGYLGLALGVAKLKVIGARGVNTTGGKASSSLRGVQRGCLGKGRRDNYRSFSCARVGKLAKAIWREYIIGAEQIYAIEIAERENDFGDDFGDEEGDGAEVDID